MPLGRVLVVDDDLQVRKSVRLTLEKSDFEVVEAEDGQHAMQAIRFGDNPLKVDTIVCDLVMPNVNGMQAVAFFRSQFPSVPVIVLTAHPTVENVSDLYKQGVVDYLIKPADPVRLLNSVKRAIDMHVLFKDKFTT
ncbi:response regulator [Nitrospira sp. Kam-Ns4a]